LHGTDIRTDNDTGTVGQGEKIMSPCMHTLYNIMQAVGNPLIATYIKPQNNIPLYSNTVIGTLTVDGWAVTFGTARRGLGGAAAHPGPSSLYQM